MRSLPSRRAHGRLAEERTRLDVQGSKGGSKGLEGKRVQEEEESRKSICEDRETSYLKGRVKVRVRLQ